MPTNSEGPQKNASSAASTCAASTAHPTPEDNSKAISRREFARKAAAVAAAASLAPVRSLALPTGIRSSAPETRNPQDRKSSLTPEQEAEVEARLANIVRKYGDRLSEDQRQHLRRNLTYHEKLLAPVRAFPLDQGDSPAFTLKLALGKDGEKGGAS